MYVSLSKARIIPGKSEDLIRTWDEKIKPTVQEFPGLKQAHFLINSEQNEAVVIVMYDTAEAAERTLSSGDYEAAAAQLAGLLEPDSVIRTGYEVKLTI